MPKELLTALRVKNATAPPAMLHDGGGLYLHLTAAGAKSWLFRYMLDGRRRDLGLGPYPRVSLAEARARAQKAREMRDQGVDPVEAKHGERQKRKGVPNFEQVARDHIAALAAKGLSSSSLNDWTRTLELYVFPTLGRMKVDKIDQDDVAAALQPIWQTKRTAPQILNRIQKVLDRAEALKFRTGKNPADWDLQQHLLVRPKQTEVHHGALAWRELPAFMAKLREQEGGMARALEFIILTAARAGDVIGNRAKGKPPMSSSEVDFKHRLWTVPAERMKMDAKHVVPLSDRAIEILESPFDVPNNQALLYFIEKRLGYKGVTTHGFRSTFRDWCAENGVEDRLAEICLAHKLDDATERAYNRTNRVAERVPLMQRWADFCSGVEPTAEVIPMRRSGT